jgi:tetratricopeptide (TPR) repeat protein
MGTGGFKVDSTVAAAQTWFDYGLALSHAFYHEDAKTAMKRAVAADPQCSACAWGEAWALGPTLNYRINEEQRVAALAAAERAKALVKPSDERAKRLADAIIARYQRSTTSTEPAFGAEMAKIAAAEAQNAELAVLAAHSLLIPVRANDRTGLKPALAILEDVLRRRPNDTGAIHYYIHGTEFDDRAEDALPYARKLGDLAPAASHLVHMPAHTFFRAGLYHDAGVVNAEAIGADARWLTGGGDATGSTPQYYGHNVAFGVAGALMSGDGPLALKLADHAALVWSEATRPGGQVVARTWVALGLYAPDRALAIPVQSAGSRQAYYRTYARGEALLRRGDLTGAVAEAKALAPASGETEPPEKIIARGVLEGRIAMVQGDANKAAELFEKAAVVQETRLAASWDPPSWWYPVRRSLAAAHLKAGDFALAEAEAKKSLASWEKDPLALWVLAEAERRQGKTAAAREHAEQGRRSWHGDFARLSADLI